MTDRARLLRKAALLTRRHSEMARLDAPALDRLGWMQMYREAADVVFNRLHELRVVR